MAPDERRCTQIRKNHVLLEKAIALRVEDYDPVLRWRCRLERENSRFILSQPAFALLG
jgi:hypothetical protein